MKTSNQVGGSNLGMVMAKGSSSPKKRKALSGQMILMIALLIVGIAISIGAAFNITYLHVSHEKGYNCVKSISVCFMLVVGFPGLMGFMKRYALGGMGISLYVSAVCYLFHCLFLKLLLGEEYVEIEMEGMFSIAIGLIGLSGMMGFASFGQVAISMMVSIMLHVAALTVFHFFVLNDLGGSISVHIFASTFSLACILGLKIPNIKKIKKEQKDYDECLEIGLAKDYNLGENSSVGDQFGIVGTMVLWALWPVFAAGPSPTFGKFVINMYKTLYSLACSTCSAILASTFLIRHHGRQFKIEPADIINWTLCGGVVCGSLLGYDTANFFCLGITSALIGCVSVASWWYLSPLMAKNIYLSDTCGIFNLHFYPGILSAIMSAIVASIAGLPWTHQIICMFVSLGIALVGGFITGLCLCKLQRLRLTQYYDDGILFKGLTVNPNHVIIKHKLGHTDELNLVASKPMPKS